MTPSLAGARSVLEATPPHGALDPRDERFVAGPCLPPAIELAESLRPVDATVLAMALATRAWFVRGPDALASLTPGGPLLRRFGREGFYAHRSVVEQLGTLDRAAPDLATALDDWFDKAAGWTKTEPCATDLNRYDLTRSCLTPGARRLPWTDPATLFRLVENAWYLRRALR